MNSSWAFTFLLNKKQMLYLNSVEISVTRYSIFFMAQFHLIWHLIENLLHLWLDEGVPKWHAWSGPRRSERSMILMRKQMPLSAHLRCAHLRSSSRFWLQGQEDFYKYSVYLEYTTEIQISKLVEQSHNTNQKTLHRSWFSKLRNYTTSPMKLVCQQQTKNGFLCS